MSADFPSSNPFRRKGPSTSSTISPLSSNIIKPHFLPEETSTTSASSKTEFTYIKDVPKKIPKKVRVQSPPPPSPSIPDSASTIDEDTIPFKPPTTIPQDEDYDPFESVTSDISDDEEINKPSRAPILNPFSKTLETMENSRRDALGITSPGRASMDVDAFKRLLLTGDAGIPTTSTPPQAPPILTDGGSSSTDTSLSRQSIFEEVHPESPRTSHEISEPDDVRRVASESAIHERRKPPPPSSRHGKLIKMGLADGSTNVLPTPTTPQYLTTITTTPNRSLTDLNKPLPPSPARRSGESERESIFDNAAAGRAPEPPSPSSSIRRKAPPTPPVTRRHSQLVIDSKISRSNSGRLSPRVEEDNASILSIQPGRPRSNSGKGPPPPPSRKHGLARAASHHSPSTTPTLPALPPIRGSRNRASSVHSIESPNPSISSISKRNSILGPPPPPRHRQTSNGTDSSTHASAPVFSPTSSTRITTEHTSRPSLDQYQRTSSTSSLSQPSPYADENIPNNGGEHSSGNKNILDDLSALQREIDALRNQSQRQRSVT